MTPRKEKALQALLVCRTRAEAAKAAGIGESTLREYMKDAEFTERYNQAFGGMVADATRQAQQTLSPALSTLREIMEDREEQASARITAARSILEYAMKLCEQTDILDQLQSLERWRCENEQFKAQG
ncbi:hypothetical protein MM35RIKEN_09240 [Vescimonas fastidiosa]|uniref:Uncharacterized protein n=2 Tax=Vescimonas fastidiosa TaxID=2714353 RepID=A0A810PXC1_9FIRM|nr:hypothetical protein MM35RIKEN_09240 [Vescimonas fastidiosa]